MGDEQFREWILSIDNEAVIKATADLESLLNKINKRLEKEGKIICQQENKNQ